MHTLVFILASLRNKKQTNLWGIILARILLTQKKYSKIWAFLCSCIQNSNLHTPIFILASLDKQRIYGVFIILARICLLKIFFQNLGFLCSCKLKLKLHALDLFWLLSGTTNKYIYTIICGSIFQTKLVLSFFAGIYMIFEPKMNEWNNQPKIQNNIYICCIKILPMISN